MPPQARRKIGKIHGVYLPNNERSPRPHHHSSNFRYLQERPNHPAFSQAWPPEINVMAIFQSLLDGFKVSPTQVQTVCDTSHAEQARYTSNNPESQPGCPKISRCHGSVFSYEISPLTSPAFPLIVLPAQAPAPTKAAAQTTPPIPVDTPSAKQIEPLV